MNSKLWIRKALTLCLVIAVNATYSMVALANSGKAAGELVVAGKSVGGELPSAFVNGEAAKTGRSIFSASTIATPENVSAVINLGKVGKIQLAPGTTLNLTFDDKAASGSLATGKVTVLSSNAAVNITTAAGQSVDLNAGESVTAAGRAQDDDDDDDDDGGAAWWAFAIIFGGAAAGILYAATQSDNTFDLGGSGTVISPVR